MINKLGKKFFKEKTEENFEKFLEEITPLIYKIIYKYSLFKHADDIYQNVSISLWKGADTYNNKKANARAYAISIIENTVKTYIQKMNTKKNLMNTEAMALNKKLEQFDNQKELHEIILGGGEFEDDIINGFNAHRLYNKFSSRLSKMEKSVLDSSLRNYDGDTRRNIQMIEEETEYTYKQIDNAIERLKEKANFFFQDDLLKMVK